MDFSDFQPEKSIISLYEYLRREETRRSKNSEIKIGVPLHLSFVLDDVPQCLINTMK
jgi:hypothetical protein